jgi:acyl CoA:acetate/3-ketoacid CoA transferase beta subunit
VGGFILGSSDLVNWVKETFLAKRSEKREILQLTELKPKLSPDRVVAAVRDEFDCKRAARKMRIKNKIINN